MPEILSACTLCGGTEIEAIDPVSSLSSCSSCGYVFDNPRPTPAEVDAFYSRSEQYDDWLAHLPEREKTWKRRLKKVLMHAVTGSLLDVGAGVGQFLALARSNFSAIAGTEISSTAVAIAKKQYGLDLESGRVEAVDFNGRTFENITLFHVLEHVHDPGQTLTRCRDILSPGGVLFIAVPNEIHSLRRYVRKFKNSLGITKLRYKGILGIPRLCLDGSQDEIHLSHFTEQSLSSAMARYGFDVIEKGLDPFYVSKGFRGAADTVYYLACALIKLITGRNVYDTLWMVGRRNEDRGSRLEERG